MKKEDIDMARMGLRLAIMEKNPLIKDLVLTNFKSLCMAAELSEMGNEYEVDQDAKEIEESVSEIIPDCRWWAIQLLMFHFSRLGSTDSKGFE